jgi:drug/metabolite transporter (DMT)-like permease
METALASMEKGPGAAASNRAVELGFLALLALFWGSSYLFVKIAVGTIPPLTLIAVRVSIAALLLCAVVRWRGASLPRDGRMWGALLVQGMLNSILPWTLLAWGQQYVASGLAGVLNSTSPIFAFFITLLWTRHEDAGGLKLLGALLGLGGVVLILGVEVLGGLGQQVAAQLAIVTGAVLYAVAAIYGKRFHGVHPAATAAGTMIWAAAVLVPLSLAVDRPWTLAPSAEAIAATLALSIFSTAGALLIYFRLVRTLGSLGVTSQSYLRSGVSVLLGMLVLGEAFTWTVGVGLVAVIVSVVLINGRWGDSTGTR